MTTSTATRVSEECIQQFVFKGNSRVTSGTRDLQKKKKFKNMYTNDTNTIERFFYQLLVSDFDSSTIILSDTQYYYDNKYKY